ALWIEQGVSSVGAGARNDLRGAAIYDRTHQVTSRPAHLAGGLNWAIETTGRPATETCPEARNPVMKVD
ncbi:MAG: hypothetical protein JSW43_02530, partial [Gemmatimonadota bacterium]